MKQVA